jgi:hypothetical protein
MGRKSPETKSDFFRREVESSLRRKRERAKVVRYVQGYVETPDTDEEAAWAKVGEAQLSMVPWDRSIAAACGLF